MIAVGACGCVGCVGVLGRDAITPVDDASAILAERGRSDDARFARVMAGGMRDYESWDEVRAFKKDLFSNVRQGDVVAEIGIGSGPNLQYYGARAKRVVAVEPNLAFEEFVTAEADASRTTLELVQGYAEALPLPDASVDVLVGTMVLCTVNDVTRSLVEARRVLKPGGKYLFTEHTKAPEDWTLLNVAQATSDPLQRVFGKGCHLRRDPLPAIRDVFGDANVRSRSFVLSNTNRGPPWPPHFLLAPHLVGAATKPAGLGA